MDNLTHALAGALTAEVALACCLPRDRGQLRGKFYLAAIISNSSPDLDFVLTPLTEGKLGYLLHHRGHTHTVLGALGLGLLEFGAFALALGRQKTNRLRSRSSAGSEAQPPLGFAWHARSYLLLALVCCLGPLLHLLLDYGNSYGVHPWWPVNNHWYYGDTVFIVEPLLVLALSGSLLGLAQSRWGRGIHLALCGVAVVGAWALPVPRLSGWLALIVLGLVALGHYGFRSQRWRLGWALGLSAGFYAASGFAKAEVSARVQAHARHWQSERPAYSLLETILTPMPAGSYCWQAILVGLEGDDYVLHTARWSLLPTWVAASECPSVYGDATAPLTPLQHASAAMSIDFEYRQPLARLQRLGEQCWFAALLRFARAPYFDPERNLVGDLRYDRSPELDFAELELPKSSACPERLPPWIPPRSELLVEPRGDLRCCDAPAALTPYPRSQRARGSFAERAARSPEPVVRCSWRTARELSARGARAGAACVKSARVLPD